MAQTTPLKPTLFPVDFYFTVEEAAPTKAELACSCGSKSFREVHRVIQPKDGTSIMYECEKCGEYSL